MTILRLIPKNLKKNARSLPTMHWQLCSSFSSTANDSLNTSPQNVQQQQFPHLFSPLDLGPDIGVLPNRAIMGSMHTGLEGHSMSGWMVSIVNWMSGQSHSEHHNHSLEKMATYFQHRAEGGVGCMVTGGIAPNRQGWTGPFSSQLTNEREMLTHQIVTDTVHAVQVPLGYSTEKTVPARICLQILHTGRYAYHPLAVSASATQSPISPFKAKALSASGVKQTIADFVKAAVLAKQAGYDGVEIMGSEGYLLSQFLSPCTNHRTDEYGGSFENRSRFPLQIVQETRNAVGKDFIIIFRISLLDLVKDGLSFEESVQLAHKLQEAGVTILNTGIGWHEARIPTIATSVPRAAFVFPTAKLYDSVSIPLVATNRINTAETAERVLSQPAADLVSMARPFLADPALLRKARENRTNEINTCIGCNQACLDHVFQSRTASCLVNPAACHETEIDFSKLPTDQRLRIGIVGAGPAGCAAAITAATKGHAVTLYDADFRIGGQFQMARCIPGKEEFAETLRYFETMFQKYKENIKVELNTRINLDEMVTNSVIDKWIVATGVSPRDPKIPGQDHPSVLSYVDVLKYKKPVGDRVAVIGAGGIGFDVCEYLLHGEASLPDNVNLQEFYETWGIDTSLQHRGGLTAPATVHPTKQIFLCQRKKGKLGAGLGKTTGWIHRAVLHHSKAVEMLAGVSYEKIDENGHLHVLQKDGSTRILEVNNIIICAGQVEQRELFELANDEMKSKIYCIGGAERAGELDAKRAIDMGTRLAVNIHKPDVVPGKHVFSAAPSVEESLYKLLRRIS